MTSRRVDGEGSIYRLPNGKWKVSISLGFDADRKRIRKTATASTKKLAAKRLAELKERYANTSIEARDYTVQSWCDEWVHKVAPLTAAPHTVGGYRSNLERHVYPRLGHIGLIDLTGKHVLDFQYQLLASGLKVASVKVARRPLTTALNVAVRFGLRDSNPVMSVPLPRDPRRGLVGTRLPKTALDELLAAARTASPQVELFVVLGATRGLRLSEICGLWWDDIDYENREIHVTHNLIESSTYGIDGTRVTELVRKDPKSVTSYRALTLSPNLERVFTRVKTQQARDRLKSPERWPHEVYVFAAKNGRPIWPRNMARSFRRFIENEDLPNISPHDLRRTFANTTSQAGAPIEQISEALGHASIGITKSLYIGQVPVLATRAFSAFDDYVNPAQRAPRRLGRP
jgi:integrase